MLIMQELGYIFASSKLLGTEGKRNHWEILSADCPECIICIEATVERCFLQSHPEAAGENMNNLKLHI